VKGKTPIIERPDQRQSISAASAVNARGGFWSCTYEGGLDGDLFIKLLRQMMAEHYGTAIMPTRPRKPRDKAKVEVGVQVVERWVLAQA
jgi:hypothetical protein